MVSMLLRLARKDTLINHTEDLKELKENQHINECTLCDSV